MPALVTPPAAVHYLKEMDARPLMDIATVAQIAIFGVTVVKMPTALHVINIIKSVLKINYALICRA